MPSRAVALAPVSPMAICPCCHRELEATSEIVVSLDMNTITFRGNTLKLSPKEIEVLFILQRAMPGAARASAIIAAVWSQNEPAAGADAVLRVYISRLRRFLLPLGLKITATGRGQYMLSDWIAPIQRAVRAA